MKIAYITTEMIGASSGVSNQNRITLKFLQDHPEVEKLTVIQTPGTEFGIPPLKRQWNGITIYTPQIKLSVKDALKSFSKEKLKRKEKIKFSFLKLILKLKGLSIYDSEKIEKTGRFHVIAAAILSLRTPFPNPYLESIANCIKKTKPDIIHTQLEHISIAGALAKNEQGKHFSSHMSTEHGMLEGEKGTLNRVFSERLLEALDWLNKEPERVDLYLPVSETVQDYLSKHGVSQNKIKISPAPIEIAKFPKRSKEMARKKLGLPMNKKIILSVGRMTPRKRFIDLVNIMPRFPKNVLLYIKRSKSIADKIMDESKAIKSKIKKYKLTNNVIIDENVLPYEEMGYIYSACDVACFPFVNEPGGNCAMEALANGKPLVVYDSGYFPYYIKNNGFIVKPENPEELHEKIKILLEDEKLATEMGEKSKELAQQYDVKIVGEKLINLYREFL